MKEFEKWLKTECIKCGAKWGHCCNECNHDSEKRAWKAALEWVLTMKRINNHLDGQKELIDSIRAKIITELLGKNDETNTINTR